MPLLLLSMLSLGTPKGPTLNDTKFYRSEHYSFHERFPTTSRIGCKIVTSLKIDFMFILYIKHVGHMHAEVIQIRFMIFFLTAFVIFFNLITFLHLYGFCGGGGI